MAGIRSLLPKSRQFEIHAEAAGASTAVPKSASSNMAFAMDLEDIRDEFLPAVCNLGLLAPAPRRAFG